VTGGRAAAVAAGALLSLALPASPADAADPLVAAAGDIACQSTSPQFNGGLGTATRCRQKYTSDLLTVAGLAAVLPLGDTQYCCGSLQSFLRSYDLSWGRVKPISHPVPGAHEYETRGAAGYFDYFNGVGTATGIAGDRDRGYYSFDLGAWHLIALNSSCRFVTCFAGSAQERWLRADLGRHESACTLAYMHSPRFSSTAGGDHPAVRPLWEALYGGGAEIVLSADAHNYERFAPQTPDGQADPAYGMRLFVVGTGGHSLKGFTAVRANSEVRHADGYGVLKVALHTSSFDWRFQGEPTSPFADAGSGACHRAPPGTPKPKRRPGPGEANCTIKGTAGADLLRGTSRRDVICGLGGADTIDAGAGNDVVLGGSGRDRIAGGRGRDRLYGGDGADVIDGGAGNDVLLGGSGSDRIGGGPGRDGVHGEVGNDRLSGDAGGDVLLGGPGRDRIRAGAGRDTAYGNAGSDVMRGQAGRDRLFGNGGRNRLYGGAGADSLVSARSRRAGDVLHGGPGADRGTADRRDHVRSVEHLLRR
jgi:acid phosphatase type 7